MNPFATEDRVRFLHARRDLKMARSAHAYVRGNTASFYDWLSELDASAGIPSGPPIWICGDCHVGNLGPLAGPDGTVAIQIRDLDQTVIGNPAHDLIRLSLSLATAARGSALPGIVTARMIEQMVCGYEAAFVSGDEEDELSPGDEPDVVRTVRKRALNRKWRHLASERLEDVKPSIPLGKCFWPLTDDQKDALRSLITEPDVSRMILSLDEIRGERDVSMVDAAYWMKGCSSLGLLRIAAIVALDDGKSRDYALIDIKEAVDSVAPHFREASLPDDPGARVQSGASALSPHLGRRMVAAHLMGHSVFIRELMPQDLKIEVEQFTRKEALKAARYLAFVVGEAHARQLDEGLRRAWLKTLRDTQSSDLDAPSWLWRVTVDLAGRHEAGYLDHCRRYALRQDCVEAKAA